MWPFKPKKKVSDAQLDPRPAPDPIYTPNPSVDQRYPAPLASSPASIDPTWYQPQPAKRRMSPEERARKLKMRRAGWFLVEAGIVIMMAAFTVTAFAEHIFALHFSRAATVGMIIGALAVPAGMIWFAWRHSFDICMPVRLAALIIFGFVGVIDVVHAAAVMGLNSGEAAQTGKEKALKEGLADLSKEQMAGASGKFRSRNQREIAKNAQEKFAEAVDKRQEAIQSASFAPAWYLNGPMYGTMFMTVFIGCLILAAVNAHSGPHDIDADYDGIPDIEQRPQAVYPVQAGYGWMSAPWLFPHSQGMNPTGLYPAPLYPPPQQAALYPAPPVPADAEPARKQDDPPRRQIGFGSTGHAVEHSKNRGKTNRENAPNFAAVEHSENSPEFPAENSGDLTGIFENSEKAKTPTMVARKTPTMVAKKPTSFGGAETPTSADDFRAVEHSENGPEFAVENGAKFAAVEHAETSNRKRVRPCPIPSMAGYTWEDKNPTRGDVEPDISMDVWECWKGGKRRSGERGVYLGQVSRKKLDSWITQYGKRKTDLLPVVREWISNKEVKRSAKRSAAPGLKSV